ncbi:MAG: hypothetical protein ABSF26_22920 [Thermoguttaceae bacterium]
MRRARRQSKPSDERLIAPEVARFPRAAVGKVLRRMRGGELPATKVTTRPTNRARCRDGQGF